MEENTLTYPWHTASLFENVKGQIEIVNLVFARVNLERVEIFNRVGKEMMRQTTETKAIFKGAL